MKQTIFEIRQQAEELIKEAVTIWKQSNQNDVLEGIESDPVFSLMLTALAYQLNNIDSDIERFKQEVIDEYSKVLVPYNMGNAIPATAVISTNLQEGVPSVTINDRMAFSLQGSTFQFIPLLETRVLGAEISYITRLDARRWKVSIDFKTPVTDLSGFSFAITTPRFKGLKATINNKPVPLTYPWDHADLPLNKSFGLDTILYKQAPTFSAPNIWFDLFAKQDVRIFCIKKHKPDTFINYETEQIDLVLEFTGITDDFVFDKSYIALNPILLINAVPRSTDLSATTPIVRVTGYNIEKEQETEQFMHLTRPAESQLYSETTVDVRTVAADRFNRGSLLKLLNSLIQKFDTDYYAFQQITERRTEPVVKQLRDGLQKLQRACQENPDSNITGTYLMLRQEEIAANKDISVQVNYLMTNGAFVNPMLNESSTFTLPTGLEASDTYLLAPPVPGCNEMTDKKMQDSIARYYFATNDRIVTTADMKAFCYNELMTRYSISSDMIESISIHPQLQEGRNNCGYEIWIDIIVTETPFIKRHFSDKIPQAELFIQKMIEVRSTTLYPIQVNIRLQETEEESTQ